MNNNSNLTFIASLHVVSVTFDIPLIYLNLANNKAMR